MNRTRRPRRTCSLPMAHGPWRCFIWAARTVATSSPRPRHASRSASAGAWRRRKGGVRNRESRGALRQETTARGVPRWPSRRSWAMAGGRAKWSSRVATRPPRECPRGDKAASGLPAWRQGRLGSARVATRPPRGVDDDRRRPRARRWSLIGSSHTAGGGIGCAGLPQTKRSGRARWAPSRAASCWGMIPGDARPWTSLAAPPDQRDVDGRATSPSSARRRRRWRAPPAGRRVPGGLDVSTRPGVPGVVLRRVRPP